ncbi:RNA polymerase sigma factor RpoE [Labilithrix luteola]|uniref:RNA polymerase sigma factor RpoE n=1 Tax=Labilithrix luteola TaxID=1391654 RepID=A0A0K1QEQ8_9BACT|nr:sigma-70 family RNA polymerase sigma factor [Labilithrix luteola]AKV03920.1 RNA polymerase sigma factor RpoE [Labilithrix luteola]
MTLASLFEEYASFVARALRRLGIPESDVEDALQEVFMIAQSKLDAIEPGKEKSYLYGIARRRASALRRSLRRALVRVERAHEEHEACTAPLDSPEQTELRHARAALDEILDAMPLALRTVLVLHELEEMEMSEIAEMEGIPAGTVASRLRRARARFEVEAERVRARLEAEEKR